MIKIKRIDELSKQDINIPNESFTIWGEMSPIYDGQTWTYKTEEFEKNQISEMVFPNENYDFNELEKDHFFVGAYNEEEVCIGLAIYKKEWHKYLYLDDLKVYKAYRGLGIGKLLLEEGKKIATENGCLGIYTVGQDNNLSACLFYVKSGFAIGGLNTHIYRGTSQAGKSNIYFYLDI